MAATGVRARPAVEAAPAPADAAPGRSERGLRIARPVGAVLLAALLLGLLLPTVTGSAWAAVAEALALTTAAELLALTALWLAGLAAYAAAQVAALPGLRASQAVVVGLASSGASNVTPAGGAVGVVVAWSMLRRYGFGTSALATYTAVTGVANLLARLLLPAGGALALVLAGAALPAPVLGSALAGGALALAGGVLVATALSSDVVATRAAALLPSAPERARRLLGLPSRAETAAELLAARERTRALLARRWPLLTAGMLAYLVLQGVLLAACLAAVGSDAPAAAVVAAYACGRLLTAVVLTPGGTGFAETGAAAVLVALGAEPGAAVAGVLLFSVFTFAAELPAGALSYAVHLQRRSWHRLA